MATMNLDVSMTGCATCVFVVAPNNVQTQIQQYHDCLDKINKTPDGKLYKALSPLQMIPGWGLTPKESQLDNALEVGGKFAAFGFFKSVSNSSFFARTPFGSMSGTAADTMEAFGRWPGQEP